jgi:hypothetical protein
MSTALSTPASRCSASGPRAWRAAACTTRARSTAPAPVPAPAAPPSTSNGRPRGGRCGVPGAITMAQTRQLDTAAAKLALLPTPTTVDVHWCACAFRNAATRDSTASASVIIASSALLGVAVGRLRRIAADLKSTARLSRRIGGVATAGNLAILASLFFSVVKRIGKRIYLIFTFGNPPSRGSGTDSVNDDE